MTQTQTHAGLRLAERFAAFRREYRQHRALRRSYDRTYAELSRMSDRDLADIGISRLLIREVAHEAVYGT